MCYNARPIDIDSIDDVPSRVWDKIVVDGDSGCWLWTGCANGGYGVTFWRGHKVYAHRLLYTAVFGPIPAKKVLDHVVCDHPSCVNPQHLRVTSQRNNVIRSANAPAGQHHRQTHCVHGHPFEGSNLRVTRQGWRVCRTCQHNGQVAWRERQRAERVG